MLLHNEPDSPSIQHQQVRREHPGQRTMPHLIHRLVFNILVARWEMSSNKQLGTGSGKLVSLHCSIFLNFLKDG